MGMQVCDRGVRAYLHDGLPVIIVAVMDVYDSDDRRVANHDTGALIATVDGHEFRIVRLAELTYDDHR